MSRAPACGPWRYQDWQSALDYVKCLNTNNYLGHNDWRLPNRKELRSLIHAGKRDSAMWLGHRVFLCSGDNYWSSSTPAALLHDPTTHGSSICPMAPRDTTISRQRRLCVARTFRQSGAVASLVISTSGNGTVTSSPSGINCGTTCDSTFTKGTTVTLTAAAPAGSTFTGWSGGVCSGAATTCQVTMDGDKTVTATFTMQGRASLLPPCRHKLSLANGNRHHKYQRSNSHRHPEGLKRCRSTRRDQACHTFRPRPETDRRCK